MLPDPILKDAETVLATCRAKGLRLASAESCTGGLIAAALTAGAGASEVFDSGFVTYSNAAKHRMLGVSTLLIETHGAVSMEVARAMAEGALARSSADIAVAVTGLAGPGGGTAGKPVGLVCFGLARSGATTHTESHVFPGGRTAVRAATVAQALAMIAAAL